jgi:hypothetical protein
MRAAIDTSAPAEQPLFIPGLPDQPHIINACLRIPGCLNQKVIDGKRARIESLISRETAELEVLDLTVVALGPNGSRLGSYEITPDIRGRLAVELAKVIVEGDKQGKSADQILEELQTKVSIFRDFKWQQTKLEETPDGEPVMRRILPSFAEFANSPAFALDRQFVSQQQVNDRLFSVKATLLLDRGKVAFDAEVFDCHGNLVSEDSFSASMPPQGEYRKPTLEFVHKTLLGVTWENMCHFSQHGLESLREKLSGGPVARRPGRRDQAVEEESTHDPLDQVDELILKGLRTEGETIFSESLASGAKISVSVGNCAGILVAQADPSDLSAFVGWIVRDDRGISEPGSVVRESLLRAAEILHNGNPEQRRHALNFLDKLSKDTAGRDAIASGASLDSLLSFSLQTDIGPLKNVAFESVAPATTEQVLELLGGIQMVQLRLQTSFKSRSRTGFDRVLFGIYPDESLFAQARNPIGGQLRGRISAATCQELGGYEEVIRKVANDLSRSESMTNVRTSLQNSLEVLVNLDPDVNTIVSPFDAFGSKVPPANNVAANAAYETAGRIADVWAHATGGDITDVRVEWIEGTDTCKASVSDIGPENSSVQAFISNKGVTKLVVHVGYDEAPRKIRRLVVDTEREGRPPISKPEQVMTKVFRYTEELSDRAPLSWKDVERSKLFEYLQSI